MRVCRHLTDWCLIWSASTRINPQQQHNISQLSENASDTDGIRYSIAPEEEFERVGEGGFRRADPRKVELWAKYIVKIANSTYINPDAAAALLMDQGIRVDKQDESTLLKACNMAKEMIKKRRDKVRKAADIKAMGKKDQFFKIIAEKYGAEFLINAGPGYDPSTFTGNFMDKHKTEKGRSKSIPAKEIAELLTEKLQKEITPQIVVEHFAHLKKDALVLCPGGNFLKQFVFFFKRFQTEFVPCFRRGNTPSACADKVAVLNEKRFIDIFQRIFILSGRYRNIFQSHRTAAEVGNDNIQYP